MAVGAHQIGQGGGIARVGLGARTECRSETADLAELWLAFSALELLTGRSLLS